MQELNSEFPLDPTSLQMSGTIGKITSAITSVMAEIKSIEKNSLVGAGTASAYKGVSDVDVKAALKPLMAKYGLAVVPLSINSDTKVEKWVEDTKYGAKNKLQVFQIVKTTYLLTHTSGEWIKFSGEGHGIDSGDKAAGKATTYALKYALLYLFMVPVGDIDDADGQHNDDRPMPSANSRVPAAPKSNQKQQEEKPKVEEPQKPTQWRLEVGDEKWDKVIKWVIKNKGKGMTYIVNELSKHYVLSAEIQDKFKSEVEDGQEANNK